MMRSIFHRVLVVSLKAGVFVALLGVFGCSKKGNPQITGASVFGVVRYKGASITGGAIRFWSQSKEGGNISAAGVINGDGTYEVLNAPLGRCKVVVSTEAVKHDRRALMGKFAAKEGAPPLPEPTAPPKKYMPIDNKYTELKTTPLEITVESGRQTRDIDLP
jgi:hypothetical protein